MSLRNNENNLLVALYRYAHQQKENFTTEAFVHVLRHLQINEPKFACDLLSVLTQAKLAFATQDCNDLIITTQDKHEQGVTDIIIRGPDKYVIVEVKVESQPGWQQLERYRNILAARDEQFTHLVLLTRHPVDLSEIKKADAHIRWPRIALALEQGKPDLLQATSMFLVEQFLDFLKEEGMAVDKVSWELVRGVESLMSLMNQLDEATSNLRDIKKRTGTAARDTNGFYFYIDGVQCWVGIFYSNPHTVVFEAYNASKPAVEKLGVGRVMPWGKGLHKWVNDIDLESEAVHFFALSPDNQQRRIEEFVTEGASAVRQLLSTSPAK